MDIDNITKEELYEKVKAARAERERLEKVRDRLKKELEDKLRVPSRHDKPLAN